MGRPDEKQWGGSNTAEAGAEEGRLTTIMATIGAEVLVRQQVMDWVGADCMYGREVPG